MERKFTLQNQLDFALLSGDHNPLHVDALGARRTMFGAPVVHGIHMVLWAIDLWMQEQSECVRLLSINVIFQKPVRVEAGVSYCLKEEKDRRVVIDLTGQDGIAARIDFMWARAASRKESVFGRAFLAKGECRALSDQDMETTEGRMALYLDSKLLLKMFPTAGRVLDPLQIAELLATTRMVGMECPGLQSIYSKLELSFAEEAAGGALDLTYRVLRLDMRFRLVSIQVDGPDVTGRVTAFLRPPQKDQLSSVAMKDQVKHGEFAGQCALVVGGSRGLGEVTAKLLAKGGANVFITYYQGKDDADRVAKEISACGGVVEVLPLNILDKELNLSGLFRERRPTHLYFFATPFIFSATRGVFSLELFNRFSDYYISGFSNLIAELSAIGVKRIFYPSSVAVDELPMNMGEYACSKIAGEMLCRYLVKCDPEKIIYLSRLPRMDTDQTASILPVDNRDPVPLMLGILRAFRDGAPQGDDRILTP